MVNERTRNTNGVYRASTPEEWALFSQDSNREQTPRAGCSREQQRQERQQGRTMRTIFTLPVGFGEINCRAQCGRSGPLFVECKWCAGDCGVVGRDVFGLISENQPCQFRPITTRGTKTWAFYWHFDSLSLLICLNYFFALQGS